MYAGSGAVGFEEDVFLGYRAGAKAYENGYSVLIGSEAGYNLQNGSITIPRSRAGIGIGHEALKYGSEEWSPISIGKQASMYASGERSPICIGGGAGYSGIDNDYSINIGSAAGYENTQMNSQVFIGYNAGVRCYDSYSTIAIGQFVFESGYKDTQSVYIGQYAGNFNDDGDKNVAIGYYALGGTSSQRNSGNERVIAIGASAGTKASGVSNSVIIGRNAMNYMSDVPSETVENAIVIGRAIGKGNGNDRKIGSYNLIIEPTCVSNPRHNTWANDYDPYIISIGSVIHGYSSAGAFADGSSQRNLMVGRQPSAQSELTSSTLTVNPDRS
jgi:hypothetical protein